ncbi:uncharacterized protein TNCV_3064161 [Trichonephila clavipes]|nr:uncharacterized protein TNCV_3064161 [Trichonephila clavipes]
MAALVSEYTLEFLTLLNARGKKELIEWCMKEGLIASSYECPKCNEQMGLNERKSVVLDGFEWRCRKKGVNTHDVCRIKDIHLIVQLPVLFNACIKLGVVIDVFPYLVPHLQRIPAEEVVGYALVHPESSVRDISTQGLFLLKINGVDFEHITYVHITFGTYYIRTVHILIVQSWHRN